MKEIDFDHIEYFTQYEVENTGANIDDVNVDTIHRLDLLRKRCGVPIQLVFNGITTGNHKSKGHLSGNAIDVRIKSVTDSNHALKIMLMASSVGFSAIGVYKNSAGWYNFHLEIDETFRVWGATMSRGEWDMCGLTLNV